MLENGCILANQKAGIWKRLYMTLNEMCNTRGHRSVNTFRFVNYLECPR